jgi:hypothetical protein
MSKLSVEDKFEVINKHCLECDCSADESICPINDICASVWGDFLKYPRKCEEAYDRLIESKKVDTEANTEPSNDVIEHPSHYTHGGMECIDEMILLFGKAVVMDFCLCNAWKYRKRAMFKNGEEDLHKSDWYIAKYKELSSNG